MRQASAEEQLWGKVYREIIFLEPLNGWGFLNKDTRSSVLFKESQSILVVLTRFEFDAEDKDVLYRTRSELSDHLRAKSGIISYLPLVRQDGKELSVTVFEQYTSEEAYASFRANSAPLR
jgi:quinol monooxygenase YgiN